MTQRPRLDVRRRLLHEWRLDTWERLGTLYLGDLWMEESEARLIRDECEERGGIPMGYGRVACAPMQLNDEQARRQFGVAHKRR